MHEVKNGKKVVKEGSKGGENEVTKKEAKQKKDSENKGTTEKKNGTKKVDKNEATTGTKAKPKKWVGAVLDAIKKAK